MKNIFCLEKIHSGRSDQADSLAKWLFNLTSEPSIKEKDHICWVCKQNFLRMKFAIEKILEIEKNE